MRSHRRAWRAALGVPAALVLCIASAAEDVSEAATESLPGEWARAAVRDLPWAELIEWAITPPSTAQDPAAAEALGLAALGKLMEGEGCSLSEWNELVSRAVDHGNWRLIRLVAIRGKAYPDNATDLQKQRVASFLDAMEREVLGPNSREHSPEGLEGAVDAIGRIVLRDSDREFKLQQEGVPWIDPPYGAMRACDILIRCLTRENWRARTMAVRWLNNIATDDPRAASGILGEMQAALPREESATDYPSEQARQQTVFTIRRVIKHVAAVAAKWDKKRALDSSAPKGSEPLVIAQDDGTFRANVFVFANEEAAKLFLEADKCRNSGDVPKAIEFYEKTIEAQPGFSSNAFLAQNVAECYSFYANKATGLVPEPQKALHWWQQAAEWSNPTDYVWARAQMGQGDAYAMLNEGAAALEKYKIVALWDASKATLPSERVSPTGRSTDSELAALRENANKLTVAAVENLATESLFLNKPVGTIATLTEIAEARAGTPAGQRATELLKEIQEKTQPDYTEGLVK